MVTNTIISKRPQCNTNFPPCVTTGLYLLDLIWGKTLVLKQLEGCVNWSEHGEGSTRHQGLGLAHGLDQ